MTFPSDKEELTGFGRPIVTYSRAFLLGLLRHAIESI